MRRIAWIAVVAVLLVAAMGRPVSSQDTALERLDDLSTRVAVLEGGSRGGEVLYGTVVITGDVGVLFAGDQLAGTYDACYGGDGVFADVVPGAEIVVEDETGTVVRSARLGPGRFGELDGQPYVGTLDRQFNVLECRMPFEVTGLAVSKVYRITLLGSGRVRIAHAQLEEQGWTVEIRLD